MRPFAILLAVILTASANHFNLEFEQDGSKYIEKVDIFKKTGVIVYDVPRHSNTSAMTLLKDYNLRLNVMKDVVQKRCYVYPMEKNEPTLDSVEKGFEMVKGKFPSNKFLVNQLNMFAQDEVDTSTLSKAVIAFCQNYKILNVEFYSEQQAEKLMQQKIKQHFSTRSKRRDVHVGSFMACQDGSTMTDIMNDLGRCWNAKRIDMIKTRCDIKYWKICGNNVHFETLTCKAAGNERHACVIPEHTRANVICCRNKCML